MPVEADVVDYYSDRLAGLDAASLPDDWIPVELHGGVYDGLTFAAPVDSFGLDITLPVSSLDTDGNASFAVYRLPVGEGVARYVEIRHQRNPEMVCDCDE